MLRPLKVTTPALAVSVPVPESTAPAVPLDAVMATVTCVLLSELTSWLAALRNSTRG